MEYTDITNFFSQEHNFNDIKILCVGDVVLDSFLNCKTNRISSESPIPVMNIQSELNCLGGTGNTACNIAKLGAQVTCLGAIGKDSAGNQIINLFKENKVNFIGFNQDGTTVKQRYVCNKYNIFRADYEFLCNQSDKIINYIEKNIEQFDCVVLSNYNYGIINALTAKAIIETAKKYNIPVFVDPNKSRNVEWYKGAFLFKPNLSEFEQIIDKKFDLNIEKIVFEAKKMIKKYDIENILITMGEHGQLAITSKDYRHFSNILQSEVIDVSGAGDTVIASVATFFCKTKDLSLSFNLANLAANLVVRRFGTSQTTLNEMKHFFYKEKAELVNYDENTLKSNIFYLKNNGKKIGLANGCFDIVHEGHIKLLTNAKKLCDFLIVAINSDKSVKQLKGESRPFNNEFSRTLILSNMTCVDAVIVFDDLSPINLILSLKPDIIFKGKDYNPETLPEYKQIIEYGGKVEFLDLTQDISTTHIINKING